MTLSFRMHSAEIAFAFMIVSSLPTWFRPAANSRHALLWHTALAVGLWCVVLSGIASADAVVVTKAMSSSTIAEFNVRESSVRLNLEIGAADLNAFVNLLPDEGYEKLTGKMLPLQERLQTFCQQELVLKADGATLSGQLEHLEVRRRIARDVVTGEPLAVQPEDAERVIEVQIGYKLPRRPQTLSITPPGANDSQRASANIGFIVYHSELPVTDFRYLSSEETLDLDWDDPWYSRFRNRNLKRQFDAPLSVFLYVENFEVRKEIIARPRDLQHWVDLGIDGQQTLSIAQQPELKKRVVDFLIDRGVVSIDGKQQMPTLDRIHFIRRSMRKTGVIEPPEDLDLTSATLGVIFVYPTDRMPEAVELHWDVFSERISSVPTMATDQAGGMPYTVSADDPVLVWKNFLTNPTVPAMVRIDPPRVQATWSVPVVSLIALVVATGLGLYGLCVRGRRSIRSVVAIGGGLLMVGVICLPYGHARIDNPWDSAESISQEEADQLLGDLLHNVYRAFDRRDERLIYDRLAQSISGDLLTDVYVQVRSSMELENQGGAKVKIDDVELLHAEVVEHLNDGGFVAECNWRASGSVGHWGHTHQQVNDYSARITVDVIDAAWKITRLTLSGVNRSVQQK